MWFVQYYFILLLDDILFYLKLGSGVITIASYSCSNTPPHWASYPTAGIRRPYDNKSKNNVSSNVPLEELQYSFNIHEYPMPYWLFLFIHFRQTINNGAILPPHYPCAAAWWANILTISADLTTVVCACVGVSI